MIHKYEVETIITNALMRLDGMISPGEDSVHTVYDASVEEAKDGSLIFSFKEDFLDKHTDRFRITVEHIDEEQFLP